MWSTSAGAAARSSLKLWNHLHEVPKESLLGHVTQAQQRTLDSAGRRGDAICSFSTT
jgi:hypothetical protein